jgi:hypothetical protein
MNLHRGVRAVTSQSWQFLKQTSISSYFERAENSINLASSSHNEIAEVVADRFQLDLDLAYQFV